MSVCNKKKCLVTVSLIGAHVQLDCRQLLCVRLQRDNVSVLTVSFIGEYVQLTTADIFFVLDCSETVSRY